MGELARIDERRAARRRASELAIRSQTDEPWVLGAIHDGIDESVRRGWPDVRPARETSCNPRARSSSREELSKEVS